MHEPINKNMGIEINGIVKILEDLATKQYCYTVNELKIGNKKSGR